MPRPSSSSYSSQGLHFTDYLRVIYKRRWTAGLAFLVVFAAGAINTLKKPQIYEATTKILIEKEARRSTTINSVLDDQQNWYDDDFYKTQYEILRSRRLAWRAVQALGLDKTAGAAAPAQTASAGGVTGWLSRLVGAPKKIAPPTPNETSMQSGLIDGFSGGLSIEPVRQTHLVTVSYRSGDPEFAAKAANTLAKEYIQGGLLARLESSKETSDFLTGQLEEQRKKVEAGERALQEYKEKNDAVALDDRATAVVQQYSDVSAKAAQATGDRIDKQAKYDRLVTLQKSGNREALLGVVGSDPTVLTLQTELRKAEAERDQYRAQGFLPEYPALKTATETAAAAQAKLDAQIGRAVDAVHSEFVQAQEREKAYIEQLNQKKSEQVRLNSKSVEFKALSLEAQSARQVYDMLLQTANQTGMAGAYKGSNIQVVDAAEVPRWPILPNTSRDLTVSFLGGCLLALGLVFGFEYLDSRIKTPDELKTHLGLPFLGLVPVVTAHGDEPILLQDAAVPPSFSEALRAIRTSVIFSSAEEGSRSVVITSTAPHEGKTLVSTNLACALAQTGQRVVLVDGDMRRPRVHEMLGRPQEPGLSNVLVGTSRLRDAVVPTSVAHLHMMPAGHIPPNPAELLGSNRYLELVHELGQHYDWVIIDAPPVMAVTDAAVIAHAATGVVFVVGAEMTPRRNAMAAVDQLTNARAKFIGAVLNRVNIQRHSYYYSPYYRKDYTRAYERTTS